MITPNERLQRVASAAWQRRGTLVWVLYAAALLSSLALPLLSSGGYLDEKALLIGVLPSTWRGDAAATAQVARTIAGAPVARQLAGLVAAAQGALPSPRLPWHEVAGGGGCAAVYTVVPAGRGDGTESLALVLPINVTNTGAAAMAAAVGVTAARKLAAAPWLAKDVAVVFVDTAHGCDSLQGVEAWLTALDGDAGAATPVLPALGQLQQALVLDIASPAAVEARLGVHGAGGQLPNLDLVYLTKRNMDYFVGLPVGLDVGWAAPQHAQREPTSPAAIVAQAATAAAFAARLAAGRPSGAHAAFLRRGVDALTLTLQERSGGNSGASASPAAAELTARSALSAAEMVLHTCNNLQERLHHSSALYVLVSPERFVSVGAYLAAPACLLAAAVLQAAARLHASRAAPLHYWQAAWVRASAVVAGVLLAGVAWQLADTELAAAVPQYAVATAAAAGGALALARCGSAWPVILLPEPAAPKQAGRHVEAGGATAQTLQAGMLAALLAVAASGLLLWRWGAAWLLLAAAVPLLQLLPGQR